MDILIKWEILLYLYYAISFHNSSACSASAWIQEGTKSYYIHNTTLYYDDGQQVCQNVGGKMVSGSAWIHKGTKSYYVHNTTLYYDDGQQVCQNVGGKMLIIESEEEKLFIQNTLISKNLGVAFLGCTDRATEGYWTCDDTSYFYNRNISPPQRSGYWDWHSTAPSHGATVNCLVIVDVDGLGVYYFGDARCDGGDNYKRTIICTRELATTSVTPTSTVTASCSDSDVGWIVKDRHLRGNEAATQLWITPIDFPCDGVITHWRYWAGRSVPFRGMVFRNVDNGGTLYDIIGINDIPAGSIEEDVTYQVPDDKRIYVQAGDVLGFAWNSVAVKFSVPGDDDNDNLETLTYFNLYDLTINDRINAIDPAGSAERAYSIQAIVSAWIQNGTKEYYFHDSVLLYDEGRQVCDDVGGQMLLIESQSEQLFIESILRSRSLNNAYLRCTDRDTEGYWMCDNSAYFYNFTSDPRTLSGYWDWGSGQPGDDTNENCLMLHQIPRSQTEGPYLFHDVTCDHQSMIICTRELAPTTVEVITTEPTVSPTVTSPTVWIQNGTKEYYIHDSQLNYDEGLQVCADVGGQMVLIESQSDQLFIRSILSKVVDSAYLRCTDRVNEGYWICDNSTYVYNATGSSGFWDWDSNEPNGGTTENCIAFHITAIGLFKYFDTHCELYKRLIICTKELTSTIAWIENGTKQYYIHDSPLNYDKGLQVCGDVGGQMLLIESEREQLFIQSIIISSSSKTTYLRCTDRDTEGYWMCDNSDYFYNFTSEPSTSGYWDWNTNEPNGETNANCLGLRTFKNTETRHYSDTPCELKKLIICTKELAPTTVCNADKIIIGWSIINRNSYGTPGHLVINQGKPFPCDGFVTKWNFYPAWQEQFRAIIFRNTGTTGDATSWQIVGINDIAKLDITPNTANSYTVPSNEIIQVQANDCMGFAYGEASPGISYRESGPDRQLASYKAGYNDTIVSSLAVGQTVSQLISGYYEISISVDVTFTPPVSSMPDDFQLYVSTGHTQIAAFWTPPSASIGNGAVTLTSDYSPGDLFSIGTTTVTYYYAESVVVGSFAVTVREYVQDPGFEADVIDPSVLVSGPVIPELSQDESRSGMQSLKVGIQSGSISRSILNYQFRWPDSLHMGNQPSDIEISVWSLAVDESGSPFPYSLSSLSLIVELVDEAGQIVSVENSYHFSFSRMSGWEYGYIHYSTHQHINAALIDFKLEQIYNKFRIVYFDDLNVQIDRRRACDSNPCQNNAACNNVGTIIGYECVCSRGYTGSTCQEFSVHLSGPDWSGVSTTASSSMSEFILCDDGELQCSQQTFKVIGQFQHSQHELKINMTYFGFQRPTDVEVKMKCWSSSSVAYFYIYRSVEAIVTADLLRLSDTPSDIILMISRASGIDILDVDIQTLDDVKLGINCKDFILTALTGEAKRACSSNPCYGKAICQESVGFSGSSEFTCQCPEGWDGDICDIVVPCDISPNPCNGNGQCSNIETNRYICDCDPGWIGSTCNMPAPTTVATTSTTAGLETSTPVTTGLDMTSREMSTLPSICDGYECLNGGLCIPDDDGPWCFCPVKWGGVFCGEDMTILTYPFDVQPGDTTDLQLYASSFETTHNALDGRHGDGSGWIPLATDTNPWISMGFMRLAHVMGVVILGKFPTFRISYDLAKTSVDDTNEWIIGSDPESETRDRLFIAVFSEPCATTYIKVNLMSDRHVNITMQVMGYFPPSPIEIQCFTNCLDLVTPSLPLSATAAFDKLSKFAQIYTSKYFDWSLEIEDKEEYGVYQPVPDFMNMTVTGTHKNVVVIRNGTLEPGRSYRLHIHILAVGKSYKEYQYYDFTTNLPPSLGQCYISPESGYAVQDSFTLSCPNISGDHSGLIYYVTSRLPGQGMGAEKQVLEISSIQEDVKLDLPVGSRRDNYTLEVVVRAVDGVGGYDESVSIVQVLPPQITANTSLVDLLISDSSCVVDKLQGINVLLSYVNSISIYDSQNDGDGGVDSVNGTNTTSEKDSHLEALVKLRTTLITAINKYATEVNTTEGAKLLITALQYATDVPEELTYDAQLTLIPSLELAIHLLYKEDIDGNAFINRDYSLGIISTLHAVERNFVDEDNKLCYAQATEAPPSTTSSNPANHTDDRANTTTSSEPAYHTNDKANTSSSFTRHIKEEPASGTEANERLEALESKVISKVMQTIYPGEEPQTHETAMADMTFYTVADSDSKGYGISNGNNSKINHAGNNSRAFEIPAAFLAAGHIDGSIGISTVTSTRNPYPGSCNMSPSKKVELRDQRGNIINIIDAEVDVAIAFERKTIQNATAETTNLATNVDIVSVSITLDQPGASGAQFVIDAKELDGFCFKVYSRKTNRPLVNRYNQLEIFPMDGDQHEVVFNDLELGDVTDSPVHYLGIKHVKCNRSIETGEIVVTSLEVDVDVNVTFKTYIHYCAFWDPRNKQWDGKGCKVSSASSLYNTICLCNHLTSFASSFVVPVNRIDFAYVFANANLAENHTVFTTVMCLLGVYVLMLIWLRKKDKEDLHKWSAHPLIDNQYGPGYFYTISVHTGFATNAGTRSTVRFDMVGEDGNTGQRLLWDTEGYLQLDDGSLNHYVLKLRHSIGQLQSLLIWHDNTGEGSFASWYLDWILVSDLQTGERWAFVCSDWLARHKGGGKIFRSLKPASEEAAAKIQSDFFRILRGTFADDNLWVSLFTRPTPSSFTRVQRLSVCLTFLFLYMITNAMFYRTDDEKEDFPEGKTIYLGLFEIDLQQVYIGGISTLIILPVNLILVILFKSVQMSDEAETGLAVISKGNLEKKRRCSAPPIMKYFAWTLVFASIVLSAFFVILYSLLWGKVKSKAWLMSMLTSFLESLVLIEPAKAVCAAIIILVIFKYSKKANFHEPKTVVFQEQLAAEKDAEVRLAKAPNAGVDSQQEEWQKKTATASLFQQIISHLAFVIITIAIILQHQDIDAFYMTREVHHMFLGPEQEFTEIRNAANFWDWTSDILLPTVYPSNDTLPTIDDKRILTDGVMFLTGPVRFRQLRLQTEAKCEQSKAIIKLGVPCRPPYSHTVEGKGQFGTEWEEWTNTTCSSDEAQYCPWSYYSAKRLASSAKHGRTGTSYAGGGYIEEWAFDPDNAFNETQHLKDNNWLDQYTTAVFVELTLYNANINLFSYVTYLIEFKPTGNTDPYPWVHTFRLYDYTSDEDIQAITVTLTFLLFVMSLLYFIIREIGDIKKSGKKYLLTLGNWLEMSIIVSSVMVLLAYMTRKVFADSTSQALQKAQETGAYVNFQPISMMEQAFSIILGTTGFLSTLKINILLSFDKRFTQLKRTMVYAQNDLLAFGIYFFIMMFAFVTVNCLVLGPQTEDYNGVLKSMQTLLVLLLGNFRVTTFNSSMQFFSVTFFVIYCVLIGFILARIFVAIVCDAFTKTRKEDQAGKEGVALEKVIGIELKRQFRELFPCKGKRDDSYKVKPKDQFGSTISIGKSKPISAWGDPTKSMVWGDDFDTIPSRTPPPAYDPVDSIWYPIEDNKEFLEYNKRSPDSEGVGLLLQRAEEALARISRSVDRM